MGWIAALTSARTIRGVRMDEIVSSLTATYPHTAHAIRMMFAQNQWIADPQFRSWMTDVNASKALLAEFVAAPAGGFEVNLSAYRVSEDDLGFDAKICLDILIYNQRLFVCADSGLYGGDIHFAADKLEVRRWLKRRLDSRCISATARYGAISVSCGDGGLWGSVSEFQNGHAPLTKIEDRSVRTRWLAFDLMNYPTVVEPQLLRNDHRKGHAAEGQRTIITALGTARFDLSFLMENLQNQFQIPKESIQYTFNSDRVLFVHTISGEFYSMSLRRSGQDRPPQLQLTRTYKGAGVRILSAASTRFGVVVETDDRVLLFSEGQWLPLLESPAISVRTFPGSRRYMNVIAITNDEGLHLVSVLKEL